MWTLELLLCFSIDYGPIKSHKASLFHFLKMKALLIIEKAQFYCLLQLQKDLLRARFKKLFDVVLKAW